MSEVLEALQREFEPASSGDITRVVTRLAIAIILGGMIGFNRERLGKAAGLRTHMMVCVGSALFVLGGLGAHMTSADISRVVQGVVTGIGFLGAGAILKLGQRLEIHGLTTAATIWLTCGVGVCVGFGLFGAAVLAVILALVVLALIGKIEAYIDPPGHRREP